MLFGMICALGSAVCFGTASVLQAVAARAAARPGSDAGVDPALLLRAVRQWRYVAGLALDGLGFVLQIVALRSLPIYAVGAALAASLAVTAVVAARLLAVRLTGTEWGAVGVVVAGLGMLGLASGREGDSTGSDALRWSMLGIALGVLLVGAVAGGLPERPRALALGLGAGCGFGVVEVAVRLIDDVSPGALVANPAVYALLVGGGSAFLLLTSALQRGSVTTATAGMVLGETIGPALVGVIWLGDETRDGLGWLAVTGFAVAVAGALALARFGEAPVDGAGAAAPVDGAGAAVTSAGETGVPGTAEGAPSKEA
ncbi:drug/metabolite transporter (DMT)-like permease [Streptomyces sp. TE33382]